MSYQSAVQDNGLTQTIMQVEKSYSTAMKKLVESRDHALEALRSKLALNIDYY